MEADVEECGLSTGWAIVQPEMFDDLTADFNWKRENFMRHCFTGRKQDSTSRTTKQFSRHSWIIDY